MRPLLRERVANTSILKTRPLTKLVFVTHDARLAAEAANALEPVAISVLTLTDVGLPEPAGHGATALHRAAGNASAVAGSCGVPALGFAQEFCIDPLLRFSGGSGPQWTWLIPHSRYRSKLYAELKKADDELNHGGYVGPDDRGAFIRCVFCLTWPDMESLVLEARVEGQLNAVVLPGSSESAGLFSEYFVPDSEERTLCSLSLADRVRYSPLHRAIWVLRNLAE